MSKLTPLTMDDLKRALDDMGVPDTDVTQTGHVYAQSSRRGLDDAHSINSQGAGLWIVSLTDLCALMLTFFVLSYAMREPDTARIQNIVQNVQNANTSHAYYGGRTAEAGAQTGLNLPRARYGDALDLNYLSDILRSLLKQAGVEKSASVVVEPRSLVMDVTGIDAAVARTLGSALTRLPNRIEIEATGSDFGQALLVAHGLMQHLKDGGYAKEPVVQAQSDPATTRVIIRVLPDDGHRITSP